MSISLETVTPKAFYGLSTDTKPTVGIPVGSTFLETDTQNPYVFDGINWDIV